MQEALPSAVADMLAEVSHLRESPFSTVCLQMTDLCKPDWAVDVTHAGFQDMTL